MTQIASPSNAKKPKEIKDLQDADAEIKQWRIKKLIQSLEKARGYFFLNFYYILSHFQESITFLFKIKSSWNSDFCHFSRISVDSKCTLFQSSDLIFLILLPFAVFFCF
jgi:hypothetical protein